MHSSAASTSTIAATTAATAAVAVGAATPSHAELSPPQSPPPTSAASGAVTVLSDGLSGSDTDTRGSPLPTLSTHTSLGPPPPALVRMGPPLASGGGNLPPPPPPPPPLGLVLTLSTSSSVTTVPLSSSSSSSSSSAAAQRAQFLLASPATMGGDPMEQLRRRTSHKLEVGVTTASSAAVAATASLSLATGAARHRCARCEQLILASELESHANSHSSQILAFLFLGGDRNAKNLKELQVRTRVSHIVNAAWECSNHFPSAFVYENYRISDHSFENLIDTLETAADFIETARRGGGRVLVHCVQGISRSASIVLAYLIKYESMSVDAALDWLKRRRSIAAPNAGFLRQLRVFEHELRCRVRVNVGVRAPDAQVYVTVSVATIGAVATATATATNNIAPAHPNHVELHDSLEAERQVEAVRLETQSLMHIRRFWLERDSIIQTQIRVDTEGVCLTLNIEAPPPPHGLKI